MWNNSCHCYLRCCYLVSGYFVLRLWEMYKTAPMAEYEVAVRSVRGACHKHFSVSFDITGGL